MPDFALQYVYGIIQKNTVLFTVLMYTSKSWLFLRFLPCFRGFVISLLSIVDRDTVRSAVSPYPAFSKILRKTDYNELPRYGSGGIMEDRKKNEIKSYL